MEDLSPGDETWLVQGLGAKKEGRSRSPERLQFGGSEDGSEDDARLLLPVVNRSRRGSEVSSSGTGVGRVLHRRGSTTQLEWDREKELLERDAEAARVERLGALRREKSVKQSLTLEQRKAKEKKDKMEDRVHALQSKLASVTKESQEKDKAITESKKKRQMTEEEIQQLRLEYWEWKDEVGVARITQPDDLEEVERQILKSAPKKWPLLERYVLGSASPSSAGGMTPQQTPQKDTPKTPELPMKFKSDSLPPETPEVVRSEPGIVPKTEVHSPEENPTPEVARPTDVDDSYDDLDDVLSPMSPEGEARLPILQEEARHPVSQEEARLPVAQEEARLSVPQEETQPSVPREEVRLSVPQEETQLSAMQEEGRYSALQDEAQRSAREDEARQSALQDEARRSLEARRSALQEEARRSALQDEARHSALQDEADDSNKNNLSTGEVPIPDARPPVPIERHSSHERSASGGSGRRTNRSPLPPANPSSASVYSEVGLGGSGTAYSQRLSHSPLERETALQQLALQLEELEREEEATMHRASPLPQPDPFPVYTYPGTAGGAQHNPTYSVTTGGGGGSGINVSAYGNATLEITTTSFDQGQEEAVRGHPHKKVQCAVAAVPPESPWPYLTQRTIKGARFHVAPHRPHHSVSTGMYKAAIGRATDPSAYPTTLEAGGRHAVPTAAPSANPSPTTTPVFRHTEPPSFLGTPMPMPKTDAGRFTPTKQDGSMIGGHPRQGGRRHSNIVKVR